MQNPTQNSAVHSCLTNPVLAGLQWKLAEAGAAPLEPILIDSASMRSRDRQISATSLARAFACAAGLALLLIGNVSLGQEQKQDPTAPSDIINKTLSKIRDVEQLDAFIQRNQILVAENKQLKTELASIQKQLAQLTKDFSEQSAKLKRQFLQMPTFEVQSKILGVYGGMALLKSKDAVIRVRDNTEMSVPVSDGGWVLMQVKKITKDMIELHFPELERTVYLYN